MTSGPKSISEKVEKYDKAVKAFTGRTPEDIEIDTGISPDVLFPEGKKILYIGDPFQVMGRHYDNSDFTTIDYEYGESAQFVFDEEKFRVEIDREADCVMDDIINEINNQRLYEEHELILEEVFPLVEKAFNKTQEAPFVHDDPKNYQEKYSKIVKLWKEARNHIGSVRYDLRQKIRAFDTQHVLNVDDMGEEMYYKDFKRTLDNIWYTALRAEKGFEDVPDFYKHIWFPLWLEIQEEEIKAGEKYSDEERMEQIKKRIRPYADNIRLKKKTKESNVIQAVFPELPFKDNSHDRIVASWSLSTHVFDKLSEEEFETCWDEIMRVLKKDGEAYIFPLYYRGFQDKTTMIDSLNEYLKSHPDFEYKLLDGYVEEMPDEEVDMSSTLLIKKKV